MSDPIQIPPTAADLIKRFEGCELKAYPDPATGGKPYTIGYGCTGPSIGPDTVWTQEQAEGELQHRLDAEALVLADLVKVPLNSSQRAAIASLVWNIGTAAFLNSTLLRRLNEADYQGAADQFTVWNRAGGHIFPGLVTRRAEERAIFLTPV